MLYPSPFAPWKPGRTYRDAEHPPGFDDIDKSFPPHPDDIDDFGEGVAVSDCYRTPDKNKYQWFCTASEYYQWVKTIWYVPGSKADSFIWPLLADYHFNLSSVIDAGWGGGGVIRDYEETTYTQGQVKIWYPNVSPFGDWELIENPLAPLSEKPWEILTLTPMAQFDADYETGWFFKAFYQMFVWCAKPRVGPGVAPVITSIALLVANKYKERRQ